MADAAPPPPKVETALPLPEPRPAIVARVEAFRAQVRPMGLPIFALPGVSPAEGRCESCGEPSPTRCPLCVEAARFVVEELVIKARNARVAAQAPAAAKA